MPEASRQALIIANSNYTDSVKSMIQEKKLKIQVAGDDFDEARLADLTRNLRRDLLELNVEGAEHAQAELPDGAKSPWGIDWNTLILTLVSSGGVVTGLLMVLNSWVQRNPQTKLHLTLPNGSELKIEGDLSQNSPLYQEAIDILKLGVSDQSQALPLFEDNSTLVELYKKMNERLNLDELKTVCFILGSDYEQLGGESLNKSGKIQLLIKYCERHKRLADLKSACQEQNPSVTW